MPFRSKRTGKWTARVRHEGRVVLFEEHHETKTSARRAEDDMRAELRFGPLRKTRDETCDSFAARWTVDYPRAKDTTNRHNTERVRKFGVEFEGIPLREVDRPTARAWAMRNPSHLSAVRAMFTDALNDGIVELNPFAGLRIARKPSSRRDLDVITPKELERLADTALKVHGDYGPEFRALILTAAYTGCRPGELMMLRRGDIDGDYLHVTRQRNKHGQITSPKNGRSRLIVFPPPAQEAIRDIPHRHSDLLFLSKTGKPLTHGTLYFAWSTVRATYGDPSMDFYEVTRHFCATYLLEIGVSHADVAVQLGHTDGGALVMSTYGHPSDENARKRLLAAFEGVADKKVTPLRGVTNGSQNAS